MADFHFVGLAEFVGALAATSLAVDRAAERSLRKAALLDKRAIRGQFSAPPRWGMDNHSPSPRGGGPGIKTGRLMRSVRYPRVEKIGFGQYRTEIRASRKYAVRVNEKYPFFEPGLREAEPEVERTFAENFAAALASAL